MRRAKLAKRAQLVLGLLAGGFMLYRVFASMFGPLGPFGH